MAQIDVFAEKQLAIRDNNKELSDQIDALLQYANETTRAGDTRLDEAVKNLCDGYGGGGGPSDIDKFMVWYSDDKVNWTPMTKHANWNKTVANTKAHQMVDKTIVNINGTIPTVNAMNHWYMPIYQCLSYFNMNAMYGANPGNYSLYGVFGNAVTANGNNIWFEGIAPTKVCTLTSSVTVNNDIIFTKTIKANTSETNFPTCSKFGVVLPASSGAANCILLGYCDITPFQLSTTAKTFYIKITF